METNGTTMSDLAVPPGEYLEEVLADLGMTKEELARRMGRPASKLSQIFNGTKRITEETALQLEKVVGVPAHFWTGLEADYRLTIARNEETQREALAEEVALVSRFCYKELAALGEVPDTRRPHERVAALQSFFGVASLTLVTETRGYRAAFRCGNRGKRSPEAIAAWLRLGERRARHVRTGAFDEDNLRACLPGLRALTAKRLEECEDQLRATLAACGVALVASPHLPKTRAHGATFRLGPRAVLMITPRGGWADVFWFSLFHEVGHILLHDSASVIVEDGEDDSREREADRFAADLLVPAESYAGFLRQGCFSREAVRTFAARIGVHPGVVVGRLQHDGLIDQSWMNDLRVRHEPEKDRDSTGRDVSRN